MDAALIDMLPSGAIKYLRSDVLNRPAIYAAAANWPTQMVQENVVLIPEYVAPVATQRMHYLTVQEQRIFSAALRRSVKIVHAGIARS
jgi:hypothetical protein